MELGNGLVHDDTRWRRRLIAAALITVGTAATIFQAGTFEGVLATTAPQDLASSLFERASSLQQADLEDTTLGMPVLRAISPASTRPLLAPSARVQSAYAALNGYTWPVAADYPLQFQFRGGLGLQGSGGHPLLRGNVRVASNKVLEKEFGQSIDEDIEKRIEAGSMNFEDFLKATEMIDKMRGLAGVMKFVPGMKQALPSKQQITAAANQARVFKRIVVAMTEEERLNPGLFFDDKAEERIEKLSLKADEQPETVDRFLQAFKMMRGMMSRLAKGEDASTIEQDLIDEGSIPPGNRKARRQRIKAEQKQARDAAQEAAGGGGFR